MYAMKCTHRAMHTTPTKALYRLTSTFLLDYQHILNKASPIILQIIVPKCLNTMAHKAQPPNPNVSNELKTPE